MSLVWQLALPDSEKIVLLALADCANDEGHCWPGMKSLAAKCSKSDRTVQASIKSLCDSGHLTRREVPGKGCNYTVHPRSDFTPEATSPPKRTTQTPEAASDKPSRTINSVPNGTGVAADPVKELIDLGVALLTATGTPEKQARSLIGKWRKVTKSDGAVLAGLVDCRAKSISNPVEWLQKRFGGARYVSPTGYEYRGSDRDVLREAERRNDMATYWAVKAAMDRPAQPRPQTRRGSSSKPIGALVKSLATTHIDQGG